MSSGQLDRASANEDDGIDHVAPKAIANHLRIGGFHYVLRHANPRAFRYLLKPDTGPPTTY